MSNRTLAEISAIAELGAERLQPLAPDLRAALEAGGAEFTNGERPGVKLRGPHA